MAALPSEPQHVGDVDVPCGTCGEHVSVPVVVQFVPRGRRSVALRCTPDMEPLTEHAATHATARAA